MRYLFNSRLFLMYILKIQYPQQKYYIELFEKLRSDCSKFKGAWQKPSMQFIFCFSRRYEDDASRSSCPYSNIFDYEGEPYDNG